MSPCPQRADNVLGALVRLGAADGHDDGDAVLLLHLLSDGASALAARLPDLTCDVLGLVVGELTVQIRMSCGDAGPGRTPRPTAGHQGGAAAGAAAAPHPVAAARPRGPGRPTDPRQVDALLDAPTAASGSAEDLDLVDLLVWASRTGVVGSADAALLLDVERTRECGGDAQLRVARAWRINERTLRRRRERPLAALQRASSGYLAACA